MRTCETYEAWLSALLDGELDPKYQAELMDHLASCPACRQYFDDLMEIQDALSTLDDRAPEGFAQSVMDAVARTPQEGGAVSEAKRRRTPAAARWRRWAAMAACLALVAAAGLWASEHLGGYGASVADKAVNYAAAPRSGEPAPGVAMPQEKCGIEACDGAEPDEPADTPNALQNDADGWPAGALGGMDTSGGAKKDQERFVSATLTTGSAAARSWVEEQGWIWEPGAEYELTPEQYEQLLTLLEGEAYDLVQTDGDGVFLLIIQ